MNNRENEIQEVIELVDYEKQVENKQVRLRATSGGIEISLMGDKGPRQDIFFLELYEGKIRTYIYSDPKEEDPTHKIVIKE